MIRSIPQSCSQLILSVKIHPFISFPATCCHSDDCGVLLRLGLCSQEAGEAEDRAGHADHKPSPIQSPRTALLRGQAVGPISRGGERDVAAHLAVWRWGAPRVPPEGSLQGARRVCERGEGGCSCRVTDRKGAGGAASREFQMHRLPGRERLRGNPDSFTRGGNRGPRSLHDLKWRKFRWR